MKNYVIKNKKTGILVGKRPLIYDDITMYFFFNSGNKDREKHNVIEICYTSDRKDIEIFGLVSRNFKTLEFLTGNHKKSALSLHRHKPPRMYKSAQQMLNASKSFPGTFQLLYVVAATDVE